jgi:hypothetical protein
MANLHDLQRTFLLAPLLDQVKLRAITVGGPAVRQKLLFRHSTFGHGFLLDFKLHQIEKPPLSRRKAATAATFSVDDRLVDIERAHKGKVGNSPQIVNSDLFHELNQRFA